MRRVKKSQDDTNGAYIPTLEEIAAGCLKAREGWVDGLDHSRERPKKLGRTAEVMYSASVEIEDDE